jgi:twitching motility protein PilT
VTPAWGERAGDAPLPGGLAPLPDPSEFAESIAPPAPASYVGPRVTVEGLLSALVGSGAMSPEALDAALGSERHHPTVNGVETALARAGVLSTERLLALKGSVAGLPTPHLPVAALPMLPAEVARATGALVLDAPLPAVGFVEDLPLNVDRVRHTLGRDDFAVYLLTAPLFADLYRATYPDDPAAVSSASARQLPASLLAVFDDALARDASDLHLSSGSPPALRVDGALVRLPYAPLTSEWLLGEFARLLGDGVVDKLKTTFDVDAAYSYGPVRFRINLGADAQGVTAALRRLPSDIPSFDDLGLPASVRAFCELERGLVLVTGPTGSGKSTTLASMLAHIGLNQSRHILTLEDPIEFVIPSRGSLVHQRELGQSFSSFSQGLRQSLRQDPDVVLVGEARDRETIAAAVTAAETGALVFATLHTYDAVSSLARMVGVFPEGEQDQIRSQLAYVLRGVVSQTLLPTTSGGRVAAYEVLVCTPAVANNLRKVDGLASLRQVLSTGSGQGMQTMEAHLARLARSGVVSMRDAEFKARDAAEFRRYLNQAD